MKIPKKRSLRACTNPDDLVELKRDNLTVSRDYWILSDGVNVTVAYQKVGEIPRAIVNVPRLVFNRMVDFYNEDQFARGKKRGR